MKAKTTCPHCTTDLEVDYDKSEEGRTTTIKCSHCKKAFHTKLPKTSFIATLGKAIGIVFIILILIIIGLYFFGLGWQSGTQGSTDNSNAYVGPKENPQAQVVNQEQIQAQRLTEELNANIETLNNDRDVNNQIAAQWNSQAVGINNMIIVANNYVKFLNYAQPHLYQFSAFLERNRYTFENAGVSLYSYEKAIIDAKAMYTNNMDTMKTGIENERQRLAYQQQLTQQENEQTTAIHNAFIQLAPLLI